METDTVVRAQKTERTAAECAHDISHLLKGESGLSVIRLVDLLIECAYISRASDIHFDPASSYVQTRFRIDGILEEAFTISHDTYQGVISRIKVLAELRTDEHHTVQDGRFRASLVHGAPINIRTSIVPTYYGESIVLRLLVSEAETFILNTLGLTKKNKEKIERAIAKPHGMILATGPTGSGKTTTLYALLKQLNTKERAIITIEDPIEYAIAGVNQIPVNARTGVTFADGLKSILRQDPNIIMVGEIRDAETAGLAVNTALTGHLVLSTLHTSDATTTLPRLLDMKIEPYLIASTVSIAIGQRLLRRLCKQCKREKYLTDAEWGSVAKGIPHTITSDTPFFERVGCEQCGNTGYRGRIGIHEVLEITNPIREAILKRSPASELRTLAMSEGMVPMIADGILKAHGGETTIEEVLRMRYE